MDVLPSPLDQEALKAFVKLSAQGLPKAQRSQQKAARMLMLDRWLRSMLPLRLVVRMGGFHFNVEDATVRKLVAEVHKEWAREAMEHETEPIEIRRHKDRLSVAAIVSAAMAAGDLNAALRGMELICRLNGTLKPTQVDLDVTLNSDVLALRSMSKEQLLAIAAGEQMVNVTPVEPPQIPAPK